ncbi:MAG: hypothetical protein RL543_1181 [Pseudomonadota bacterium]
MAEARQIIQPVRIDDRIGLREFFRCLMVVKNDCRNSQSGGFQNRLVPCRAAINGHEKLRPGGHERCNGFHIRTIPLGEAVGNMDQTARASSVQKTGEKGH